MKIPNSTWQNNSHSVTWTFSWQENGVRIVLRCLRSCYTTIQKCFTFFKTGNKLLLCVLQCDTVSVKHHIQQCSLSLVPLSGSMKKDIMAGSTARWVICLTPHRSDPGTLRRMGRNCGLYQFHQGCYILLPKTMHEKNLKVAKITPFNT